METLPGHVIGLVLAAGKGTRMRSELPKVLHAVAGRTMLERVIDTMSAAGIGRSLGVIGYKYELVRDHFRHLDDRMCWVVQHEQRGTGHALMIAEPELAGRTGTLVVLSGDVPLLRADTLREFVLEHERSGAFATLLTTRVPDPTGYGRIVRASGSGQFRAIVEERDATQEQRGIDEINAGLYCLTLPRLFGYVQNLTAANAQGEYYLTDVFAMMVAAGERVEAVLMEPAEQFVGINTRVELARVEKTLFLSKARELMLSGVTIHDPDATYIHDDVSVGTDTAIYPGVSLLGRCAVGRGGQIRSWATVRDSTIGDRCLIKECCTIEGARLGDDVVVGPMANLRPGTSLGSAVHIGNYVEVKASSIGEGSKANHLTYLGDAQIGKGVNVGAGTITCNYDGRSKHATHIGDEVFIGSDSILVAPITVGDRAYVGAGSVVTRDVPAEALAIARQRQVNKEGYRRIIERRRTARPPHAAAPKDKGSADQ